VGRWPTRQIDVEVVGMVPGMRARQICLGAAVSVHGEDGAFDEYQSAEDCRPAKLVLRRGEGYGYDTAGEEEPDGCVEQLMAVRRRFGGIRFARDSDRDASLFRSFPCPHECLN